MAPHTIPESLETGQADPSARGLSDLPPVVGSTPTVVTPYPVPVQGGYAYVCGTGHAHVSYGAAEQCGTPWCDYCERHDHDTEACTVVDHDDYDQRYQPEMVDVPTYAYVVKCADGAVRHGARFGTYREAQRWADWGHACTVGHTFHAVTR